VTTAPAGVTCHATPPTVAPARDSAGARADLAELPVVAIVGRPNVGKSTFLARATGSFVETANVPGTTVGVDARRVVVDGIPALLVDLPGTFTLTDRSSGLPPFWELLLGARPDAILAIVDAGDVARHLPLVLACRDLGLPVVVAANLADEAEASGVGLDRGRLAQLLVAPVHRTVGRHGVGVGGAVADAVRLAVAHRRGDRRAIGTRPAPPYPAGIVRRVAAQARDGAGSIDGAIGRALAVGRITAVGAGTLALADELEPLRWVVAERWAVQVERRREVPLRLAERLAAWTIAPWPGLPLLVLVTLASLVATMVIGTALAGVLGGIWGAVVSPPLTAGVSSLIPIRPLAAAVLWAIDSGLLAMLSVGIPFVLSFYVILALLEDSGYLATAAVLSDRLCNALGLSGRAAIPILAATGCNVPAVYGTRVLGSRRERLIATFLAVLTPCSARSAVVLAALAPFVGPLAALAAFGIVAAVTVAAGLAANRILPGEQPRLVLELPRLRAPIPRHVITKAAARFRSFLRVATPVMLGGSFVLGLAFETGALVPVEAAIGPVFEALLGLPAVAGVALALAFLRKELALQLLLVLAVAEFGAVAERLDGFLTPGQLFVYAIATAISVPCAATLAALVDELGRRAAAAITLATLATGLGVAAIVARVVGVA